MRRNAFLLVALTLLFGALIAPLRVRSAERQLFVGGTDMLVSHRISPDEHYIAVASSNGGNAALPATIDLVRLDGSGTTRLLSVDTTTDLRIEGWTSDSRSVIVSRRPLTPSHNLPARLYIIDIDDGDTRLIGDSPDDLSTPYCVSFSCYDARYKGQTSDGSLIVTTVRNLGDHHELDVLRVPRNGDISSATRLAVDPLFWGDSWNGTRCILTPNAQRLVCVTSQDLDQLLIVNTDGGRAPRWLGLPGPLTTMAITPDSTTLLMTLVLPNIDQPGQSLSFVFSFDLAGGTAPVQLNTQPIQDTGRPAVTDGTSVFFVDALHTAIWRARVGQASSAEQQVTLPADGLPAPILAATATHLLLTYDAVEPKPGFPELYSLRLEQPDAFPVQLAPASLDRYQDTDIVAPDGQHVVYRAIDASSQSRFVIVPIDGPASAVQTLRTDGLPYLANVAVMGPHLIFQSYRSGDGPIAIVYSDGQRPPSILVGDEPLVLHSITDGLSDGRLILWRRYQDSKEIASPYYTELSIVDAGTLHGGFATPALCGAEQSGHVVVPIMLENAPVDTRTLSYTISGGTATADDFNLPPSGTITFAPGQRRADLDIPLAADMIADSGETLTIELTTSSSDIELEQAAFTLTIRDDAACQSMLPNVMRIPKTQPVWLRSLSELW